MRRASFLLALLSILAPAANASVIFTTVAGATMEDVSVSARAKFTIDSTNQVLTIELTNTSDGPSINNPQILTGITWQIQPSTIISSLALTPDFASNPTLTTGSEIWTRTSNAANAPWVMDNSVPIGGAWTNALVISENPPGDDNYGYSTSGLDDLFASGTYLRGTGGGDYGIVSASTFGGTNTDFPAKKPVVQNSITIKFAYIGDEFTESNIVAAHIFFATDGTFFETDRTQDVPPPPPPPPPVPEPMSLAIWGLGLGICGVVGMRRRIRQRA